MLCIVLYLGDATTPESGPRAKTADHQQVKIFLDLLNKPYLRHRPWG